MSAGGPHNPKPISVKHEDLYHPPIAVHPYGYTIARCFTCGSMSNWATEDEARAWLDDHMARHDAEETP